LDPTLLDSARWDALAQARDARVLHVERLEGGVSAEVLALTLRRANGAEQKVVLRQKAGTLGREALAMDRARAVGLPVPAVEAVSEGLTPNGAPALLMPYIPGHRQIDRARPGPQLQRMAAFLAKLHQVDIEGLDALPWLLDPLPELPEFLAIDERFAALRRWVERVPPAPYGGTPVLLHGDFWPGNLRWEGEELVGVLDWEDCHRGDPMVDVALTRLELRYLLGPSGAERFTEAYGAQAPVDLPRLALWDCYVASAALTYMGSWGLPEAEVTHMRREATAFVHEATARLEVPTP
jgi:aminoglycoside phosphotransferase (APT) family kinase protein